MRIFWLLFFMLAMWCSVYVGFIHKNQMIQAAMVVCFVGNVVGFVRTLIKD